jgi:class 3 adenylate cyclase/tetratricopeptide (TPR) repeat protein
VGENDHQIESDRRLVTVMFADISGFTAMSEKMDPEDVSDVMKDCFSMMGECIEEHGGTIDKFMGDCVMVLFGAPKAQEDAPHRALNTALEIRKRLKTFNKEKKLLTPLNIHIGINTGPVIAGMMGSEKRQDFTVMGDAVNLASRMESTAETGDILVAEDTYRLTEGYFDFEPIGGVKVKGKEQPVKAYKVLGPRRIITRVAACQEKGLSPFVGRNLELDTLNACLEKVKGSNGQVIGVMGEPGVGKSRLVCQFRESLSTEEYTCIEGGCIHFGDSIPYLPILDMLRDYFDISEDEDETIIKKKINDKVTHLGEQSGYILPPLHEVLSLKAEDDEYIKLDAKQRHDRVFEAIRLLLIAESQMKPLIITVEDLHWMDKISEEFLSYLINSIAATRIMLILLFRPEYNSPWSTKTFYSQIRLDQLPRKTIEDLVTGILGCGDVEHELIDLIANRTEGNPLFIEELTFNLMENGAIKKDDNRYSLSLKASEIQVPATIQGIIAARLDRLEGRLKGVMQTASVIGREFAFRILHSVASLKEDLKSSMLTLQDMELIYEKCLFPELEYIFKHALTQEVAYNSLLIKKRKETHERVGQAIEQIYEDRMEEFYEMLAYHYSISENTQKAYEYLKLSGDKAAKNYANWEAVRFYKETIRVLNIQSESIDNKRLKLQICLSSIGPLFFLGYPEGTLEILSEAERNAQDLGNEEALEAVYGRLSHFYSCVGDMSRGVEYSEKHFIQAEKNQTIDAMVPAAIGVCTAYTMTGDYAKVVDIAQRALRVIEEHHREKDFFGRWLSAYSSLCGFRGFALGALGEFEEGRKVLGKGIQNAHEGINDKFGITWTELNHSQLSFFEGDADDTIDHAQKAIHYGEEIGIVALVGLAKHMLGGGYYLCGDYEKSIVTLDQGLKIGKEAGIPVTLPALYFGSALVHSTVGNMDYARECVEESLKLSVEYKAKGFEGAALIVLGSIIGKMESSGINEARRRMLQGIELLKELKVKAFHSMGYLYMGELFADAGMKKEALEYLKKAEVMYLEMNVTPKSYWLGRTQKALAKLNQ